MWPRVQISSGAKVVSVLPVVMPWVTAQEMARFYTESAATSVNVVGSAAGEPASR